MRPGPRRDDPRRQVTTRLASLLGGLLLHPLAMGQLTPNAPVEDFRLPRFTEAGNLAWEMLGDRGRFGEEGKVEVEGLTLRIYRDGFPPVVETTITSPLARIATEEERASGPTQLSVEGPSYSLEGEEWEWDGANNRIHVGRNARVVFQQPLDALLR